MAKNGYKMIDAELHVMEPVDLWENYIADEFKDRAPKRMSEGQWDIRTLVEGEMMNDMAASGPYSVSGRNKAYEGVKSEDEVPDASSAPFIKIFTADPERDIAT